MTDEPMDLASLLAQPVDHMDLLDRLHSVIDPELGVNIVDLGLVYGAEVVDGVARVTVTTTTPACPLGSYMTGEIRRALFDVDTVLDVQVEVTYEPRWSVDRMTDRAKAQLGWPV
ncbi:MAG TPA: metal-sulfur cluster assembly factor [Candidatus Limnocylindria bacterium]|nr:metal-sulfur cluster assembly factor [Candidatus Limnocylindria bacterium]